MSRIVNEEWIAEVLDEPSQGFVEEIARCFSKDRIETTAQLAPLKRARVRGAWLRIHLVGLLFNLEFALAVCVSLCPREICSFDVCVLCSGLQRRL